MPGSHLEVSQIRGPNYQLDPIFNAQTSRLKTVPLTKGQAIIYDTRSLHASTANLFKSSRIVASSLVIPAEAEAKYYYFDPELSEKPMHEHDVSRLFYLENCHFNRTKKGWLYSVPGD